MPELLRFESIHRGFGSRSSVPLFDPRRKCFPLLEKETPREMPHETRENRPKMRGRLPKKLPTRVLELFFPLGNCFIFRQLRSLERVKGIEPSSQAWEAHVLPLNHTRNRERSSVSQSKGRIAILDFAGLRPPPNPPSDHTPGSVSSPQNRPPNHLRIHDPTATSEPLRAPRLAEWNPER